MTKRQMIAEECLKKNYNCAQAIVVSFGDLTDIPEELAVTAADKLGCGTENPEEVCGALGGALLVLGILLPHENQDENERKQNVYRAAMEFRRRFMERFGSDRCQELVQSEQESETADDCRSCTVPVVKVVDMLEAYLREFDISA